VIITWLTYAVRFRVISYMFQIVQSFKLSIVANCSSMCSYDSTIAVRDIRTTPAVYNNGIHRLLDLPPRNYLVRSWVGYVSAVPGTKRFRRILVVNTGSS